MPTERKLTPMLEQYMRVKSQHVDALLFYRMGDFYELFFEDALVAAPALQVTLTSRDKKSDDPIPMCGVPYHALNTYVKRALENGFKVAICEQMEDPSSTATIVKREVVRVVTPGLLGDPDLADETDQNLIGCLYECPDGSIDLCFFDLFRGRAWGGIEQSHEAVLRLLEDFSPKELLLTAQPNRVWLSRYLKLQGHIVITTRPNYFQASQSIAYGALLKYVQETQKVQSLEFLDSPESLRNQQNLVLDSATLRSLEIVHPSLGGDKSATLYGVLNKCQTPMGKRLLADWLKSPSADIEAIQKRHEVVDGFLSDAASFKRLTLCLEKIRDLERLGVKTALGLSNPRDILAIRNILSVIPDLRSVLTAFSNTEIASLVSNIPEFSEERELLERALKEEVPTSFKEGMIFRDEFHPELQELRTLSRDAKSLLAKMEDDERESTGISNLKLKYSRVFGYAFEVSKSQLDKVPQHFFRKQTIANGERFVTDALKILAEKITGADDRMKEIEEGLFLQLRRKIAEQARAFSAVSREIAKIDVLSSFAKVAQQQNYVRPTMHTEWDHQIQDGRHPVVESLLNRGEFVPNSCEFNSHCRTILVTGPNMAGKSTVMRQIALISLMAQAGSFVPAKSAQLSVVDGIYTRIGSADDVAHGRSTFMVEMSEMARILERATSKSLVIIDEVGRGTSTYDGLALAQALLEHLHTHIGSKILFATHFHELTALGTRLEGLRNFHVSVNLKGAEITFEHVLKPGPCLKSYGVEVARLARLPADVLARATKILLGLEANSQQKLRNESALLRDQLDLFLQI